MNRAPDTQTVGALPKRLLGYDVVELLGRGAASTIYAVSDPKTQQLFAVKHVEKKSAKDQRWIEQVENEFKVGQAFKHPALRKSYEFKLERNMLFQTTGALLRMELVHGSPLGETRPTDLGQIMRCFIQVAQGLGAMHYQGWIHCDLKPSNILIGAEGAVKLIDFGQTARAETVKERIQGTPDFIAPEQVKLKPVSERTDVFNFGATLYWTLTGQCIPTLFTIHKGQKAVLEKQQYPSPRERNPETPEALSELVMDCVRVHPLERPKDMTVVGEALQRIAAKLVQV